MTSYYDEWTNAGYPSDMASAKFLPPPSDSSLIRAYHLTSSDYAISAISLRRLKVARFDDANDPFELNPLDTRVQSIRRAYVPLVASAFCLNF